MRFSLAIFLPLAAAIMPALSGTINARKTGESVEARDYGTYALWRPSWTWPGPDNHCPYDAPIDCPCLSNPTCGFDCPHYWPEPGCTWDPVFEYTDSWKGWKPGKHDPFSCGYVDNENYENNCKILCSAHKDCHSCQVYTLEETAAQFICALFEEIIDISTWEDYCENDWVGRNKYYNTSYWNAHYEAY